MALAFDLAPSEKSAWMVIRVTQMDLAWRKTHRTTRARLTDSALLLFLSRSFGLWRADWPRIPNSDAAIPVWRYSIVALGAHIEKPELLRRKK
jgi:hypothetical protein